MSGLAVYEYYHFRIKFFMGMHEDTDKLARLIGKYIQHKELSVEVESSEEHETLYGDDAPQNVAIFQGRFRASSDKDAVKKIKKVVAVAVSEKDPTESVEKVSSYLGHVTERQIEIF